jgi:hypothetical protein
VIALLLLPAALSADEVVLKGGGRISGEIVERTGTTVTVDIGAGTMTVSLASVARIEDAPSALGEYRKRAAATAAGDIDAWRELGRWAAGRGLQTQAREAYSRVLASAPGDAEANEAFGRVYHGGAWVSEEEAYRAQGYVLFEGEWMTPEERSSILAENAAREAAESRALAEQIRADEEAYREREAQEQAERDAWRDQGFPRVGDPVYWGWGVGPTSWPAAPGQDLTQPIPPPTRPATLPARGR